HASPTCVISYGEGEGAVGWRIGDENRGLEAMFTMMNSERLGVGVQGVAIAERAYQQARDYARNRVQGTPIGMPRDSGAAPPIVCATRVSRRSTKAPTASRPTISSAASSGETAARQRAN